MKTWEYILNDRPGDDEKRMVITLCKRLAAATGKSPEDVYGAAQGQVTKLRKQHQREFLLEKHKDILVD